MGELEVVAGVEPAARRVDRAAGPGEVGVGDDVAAAALEGRGGVDGRVGVVQVGGLALQGAGDHIAAVALGLEEGHAVRHELPVHRPRLLDRHRGRHAGNGEAVVAGVAQGVKAIG